MRISFTKNEFAGNLALQTGISFCNSSYSLTYDVYITTELMARYKQETQEFRKKVQEVQVLLGCSQEKAEQLVRAVDSDNSWIKRPDLYFQKTRKDIDTKIRYEFVPELISKYKIDKAGNELGSLSIFSRKYSWIPKNCKNNAEMLARYFNMYLKDEIGRSRDTWRLEDYEIANNKLDELYEYVDALLDDFAN